MAIKTIPFSLLETDLNRTLNECAESGETVVVEMPNQRLLSIQSLDTFGDDDLINELLASNSRFRALIEKSKASPKKPFTTQDHR